MDVFSLRIAARPLSISEVEILIICGKHRTFVLCIDLFTFSCLFSLFEIFFWEFVIRSLHMSESTSMEPCPKTHGSWLNGALVASVHVTSIVSLFAYWPKWQTVVLMLVTWRMAGLG